MNKKKRALVFSGGGSRACDFVGVLRSIERLGIPFDIVGGTSAGSLFALLWAAGYTAADIASITAEVAANNKIIKDINWRGITKFIGSGFRQKHLTSLLHGQKLAKYIEKKMHSKGITTLGDLKMPYFCLATDIDREEEIVFSTTSHISIPAHLPPLASSSIPAIFPPVHIHDRCLVDGACKTNYPILPAIALGATEVWAVYLTGDKRTTNTTIKNGIFDIIKQTIDSVVHDQAEADFERAEYLIGKENIHLFPIKIPSRGLLDFSHAEDLIKIGEREFLRIFREKKE